MFLQKCLAQLIQRIKRALDKRLLLIWWNNGEHISREWYTLLTPPWKASNFFAPLAVDRLERLVLEQEKQYLFGASVSTWSLCEEEGRGKERRKALLEKEERKWKEIEASLISSIPNARSREAAAMVAVVRAVGGDSVLDVSSIARRICST